MVTPERIAELRSWNTLNGRWRIWDSPEFKEYVNNPTRHFQLGVMDIDDQVLLNTVNGFLDSLPAPVEDDIDWRMKYYELLFTLEKLVLDFRR